MVMHRPEQTDLRKLPPGDENRWGCTIPGCVVVTQGGSAGRDAHLAVVHRTGPRFHEQLAREEEHSG